jgi:AraC-like DNA-binding protein
MKLYNPIREIVNTIKNEPAPDHDPGAITDEMSYILSHVKYVTERNRSLDNGLRQVDPAFKDHSLRSLTLGIPNGMISESASGFKLNWPYNHFTVVVVRISFRQESTPADKYKETMTDDFWHYFQKVLHSREELLGVLTYIGKNQITILVNLQSDRTLEAFLQEVEPQIGQYTDKYHCSISLGVGGLCKALAQINESYEEALKVLGSRNIKTGYQILYHNKHSAASAPKSALDYPAENERQLMNSVLAGDHDKVVEIINIIIANNLFGETTHNQLDTMFDRLIGTARKIIKKDRGIKKKFEEKKLLYDHSYNKPDTPAAVRREVLKIFEQITEAFHHKRRERTPDLRERLVRYIQENYPVPDLSLDTIADEFGLNPKYVSRFFKEQTGTNYHDYLNKIRVSKSKELLVRGDKLKVQEISRLVGFYNVDTFITVFKRYEGITPNMFRKLPHV